MSATIGVDTIISGAIMHTYLLVGPNIFVSKIPAIEYQNNVIAAITIGAFTPKCR